MHMGVEVLLSLACN